MDPPSLELRWLASDSPPDCFPDPGTALRDPNGLLAAGGDLSVARLLYAYRHGIFPWYSERQPILWWSPDPRAVLLPAQLHVSHSLRKQLRRGGYGVSFDTAFDDVVTGCAAPRRDQTPAGTWITPAMQTAYSELHHHGYAHSIEIRMDGELVGGLYGVALGGVFFGESMFSRRDNASKIALVCLATQLRVWGYSLIDCQVFSAHLARFGCIELPRRQFLEQLQGLLALPGHASPWRYALPLEF